MTAEPIPHQSASGDRAMEPGLPWVARMNVPPRARRRAASSYPFGLRRLRTASYVRMITGAVYCRTVAVPALDSSTAV